jgi:hypothetical protein
MAILGEFTLRPQLLPASRAAMEDRNIWVLGILRLLESFWLGIDGNMLMKPMKTVYFEGCENQRLFQLFA